MSNSPGSFQYQFLLVGWPLVHSLSPLIHSAALEAASLQGGYHLYPIPPLPKGAQAMSAVIDQMRSRDLQGVNLTIPHKQSVIPLLDGLTGVAKAIGAVNLIYPEDGRLIGDNSDAPAFLLDLQSTLGFTEQTGRSALILGAGGAARAAVYVLLQAGWHVVIASRKLEAARQIVGELSQRKTTRSQRLSALPLEADALGNIAACDLIVNGTPVGMLPQIHENPWPAGLPFPPPASVYDMVYNPSETALIRAARSAGMPGVNGLGMLVEQAALSFERWTGHPADRRVMREAAMNALQSTSDDIRSISLKSD
jgi:shikimate dehydrogenase